MYVLGKDLNAMCLDVIFLIWYLYPIEFRCWVDNTILAHKICDLQTPDSAELITQY
jgi:hypothetical protein